MISHHQVRDNIVTRDNTCVTIHVTRDQSSDWDWPNVLSYEALTLDKALLPDNINTVQLMRIKKCYLNANGSPRSLAINY